MNDLVNEPRARECPHLAPRPAFAPRAREHLIQPSDGSSERQDGVDPWNPTCPDISGFFKP
jgi:hypothetical protein